MTPGGDVELRAASGRRRRVRPGGGWRRATASVTTFGLVAGSALALSPAAAAAASTSAAPGNPGVPSDPVELFHEDFEQGLADGQVVPLLDYVGVGGQTYTAEPSWDDPAVCNGFVLDGQAPDATITALGCGAASQLRTLATNLGTANGTDPATANHAVAAYTAVPASPDGAVAFRTVAPLDVSVEDRFLTFSVAVSAINCNVGRPALSFSLDDGTTELPVTSTPINPCPGANSGTGTFASDGSILFTGDQLGIVMRNENGGTQGNDHAYDDIRLFDATPQLDKEFASTGVVGVPFPLTFTVTNTSELAEKTGWSFTDTLPAGLLVGDAAPATTCAAATVDAPAGTDTIAVTAGSLAAGATACTITIEVVAGTAGAFTNGAADVTDLVGIDPPADTTVTVVPAAPALSLVKDAQVDDTNGNGFEGDPGDVITYTFTVTNTGNVPLADIAVLDPLPGLSPVDCGPPNDLAVDDVRTCTATYTIGLDDAVAGGVDNEATATAETLGGSPVTSDPDAISVPAIETPISALPPFSCPPDGLLFQYPSGPTLVRPIDMVTGEVNEDGALTIPGQQLNGVGYNVLDDYVYGSDQAASPPSFVRVGADGQTETLAPVPADGTDTWPANGFVVGDVDADGIFWALQGSTVVRVDLEAMTFTTSVADLATDLGAGHGLSGGADWAYVPGTDKLWRLMWRAADTTSVLVSYERTSGTWAIEAEHTTIGDTAQVGAIYADDQGFVYASNNADGRILRLSTSSPFVAELFAVGPASSSNDGARCASAPVLVDLGDAPATYGTTLAQDGPRHGLRDFDPATGTAPLMLGELVDAEPDGQPGPLADGDDTTGLADEDAIEPPVVAAGTAPVLAVAVTNDTAEPATLAGWIDLDGDGSFSPGERVVATVPAGSGLATYELAFGALTTVTDTYARLRVFPGVVADPSPLGAASAGEVEDHLVTVANDPGLTLVKTADLADLNGNALADHGEVLTYTFELTNTGNVTLTGVGVDDPLPGLSAPTCDGPDTLAPTEVLTCTATYVVTLADVAAGAVTNAATATGVPPGGDPTDPFTSERARRGDDRDGRPDHRPERVRDPGRGLRPVLVLAAGRRRARPRGGPGDLGAVRRGGARRRGRGRRRGHRGHRQHHHRRTSARLRRR
ncbi:DUF11 domain-containing protein [Nitriliruptoraceae bacterium ZYF776]|nr:DUF11 domain-containing protein [Profundirhabdus halotolerans]